jgi:hypothetical protein
VYDSDSDDVDESLTLPQAPTEVVSKSSFRTLIEQTEIL